MTFDSSKTYAKAQVRTDLLTLAKTKITDDMTVAEAKKITRARVMFDDSIKQAATRWLLEVHNKNVTEQVRNWTSFSFELQNGRFENGRVAIDQVYAEGNAFDRLNVWSVTKRELIRRYGK